MLRRVLALGIAAVLLGAAAMAALAIDQSLALQGNALPEVILRALPWIAVAVGILAVALWGVEHRRSRAPLTFGALSALVAIVATPIAVAIVQPDDTDMTIVALDARTGQQRWQGDVGLLFETTPIARAGSRRIVVSGYAPGGRCTTRADMLTLDDNDGRTLARAKNTESPGTSTTVPRSAGNIRLDASEITPQHLNVTVRARDATGRVLWSTAVDSARLAVRYADPAVVAVYVPGSSADAHDVGAKTAVAILDARTGRTLWTLRPNMFTPPVFNPDVVFAIEGTQALVRATATGAVIARHQLAPVYQDFTDADFRGAGPDRVALVEGGGRRVTMFDRSGAILWKATLPRAMTAATMTALDETIYVSGGGSLGYDCGGE